MFQDDGSTRGGISTHTALPPLNDERLRSPRERTALEAQDQLPAFVYLKPVFQRVLKFQRSRPGAHTDEVITMNHHNRFRVWLPL